MSGAAVSQSGAIREVHETTVGSDEVVVRELDHDRALRELVIVRGGERWTVRLHYDGGIEPVDDPRTAIPQWVGRVVRDLDIRDT